jgi:hypothetical protein
MDHWIPFAVGCEFSSKDANEEVSGDAYTPRDRDAYQQSYANGCCTYFCIGIPKTVPNQVHELVKAETISLANAEDWDQRFKQLQSVHDTTALHHCMIFSVAS